MNLLKYNKHPNIIAIDTLRSTLRAVTSMDAKNIEMNKNIQYLRSAGKNNINVKNV